MMESIQSTIEKMEREIALVTFRDDRTPAPPLSQASDALWRRMPHIKIDRMRAARERIVTLDRTDAACTRFDTLRTKIMRLLRQNNWTSVAITSPTPKCGKTVLALNLAFSLSSLKDCRTAVVDLDLRQPKIGTSLGLEKMYSMERFLKGDLSIEEAFTRYGDNVAIGANAYPVSYAAELLQSQEAISSVKNLKDKLRSDVILFDLPPMLASDDVLAFLPNVDCVLLVAAAEESSVNEIDVCERTLAQESHVLGVVLNKCHYPPERYGY